MSFFSTRVRYSLRFMMELHRASREGRPVALGAAASQAGISTGYLESLVRPLIAAGLVRGRRGANGGYQLARVAAEVSLREIVEAAIGPLGVSECVADPEHCQRAEYCECRLVFRWISLQIQAALRGLSLADMSDVRALERVREQVFLLEEELSRPALPGPPRLPRSEGAA